MSRTKKRKPWYKPPKALKRLNRQIERAKEKDALRKGEELPVIKKHDVWDYT